MPTKEGPLNSVHPHLNQWTKKHWLRGEKLEYKPAAVAKEISTPPFLPPEVQRASKYTVFVRFAFPLNVT